MIPLALRALGILRTLRKAASVAFDWARRNPAWALLIVAVIAAGVQTYRVGVRDDAIAILAGKVSTANRVNRENVAKCKAAIDQVNAATDALAKASKERQERGQIAVRDAQERNRGILATAGRLERGTLPEASGAPVCATPKAVMEAMR